MRTVLILTHLYNIFNTHRRITEPAAFFLQRLKFSDTKAYINKNLHECNHLSKNMMYNKYKQLRNTSIEEFKFLYGVPAKPTFSAVIFHM